ncbi:MAG: exonuclease SbcCD subunit D [Planctomycetales bacterium]
MEPFRFVHAARLLIDHPLQGTGWLPDPMRSLAEDATRLAFERIVETCLNEQVDALLLAGDSVDHRDASLRAWSALRHGCERLAEAGIPVVIVFGLCDPWEGWPAHDRWPANVFRLGGTVDGPDEVPLFRDDRLLATVQHVVDSSTATEDSPWLLKLPNGRESDFRITLASGALEQDFESPGPGHFPDRDAAQRAARGHYGATGGGPGARTVVLSGWLTHDPGPPQGIHPRECGPRGCTLVRVDSAGATHREFIATAPIRFEQLGVVVTPPMTCDELQLEMLAALEQLPRYPSDRGWLIAWNVSGQGPWLETLADPQRRGKVLDEVHSQHGLEGLLIHSHAVRVCPQPGETPEEDDLAAAFDRALAAKVNRPHWLAAQSADRFPPPYAQWNQALGALVAELDPQEVSLAARRLGRRWLAAEESIPS